MSRRFVTGTKKPLDELLARDLTELEAAVSMVDGVDFAGQMCADAAGSLREGLEDVFTIRRIGIDGTLARTLTCTNVIESMIGICSDHSVNVKRWRDGAMALRWCAAGMGEASKQFRRVNGHLHLPVLRKALNDHAAVTVTSSCETGTEEAA